MYLHWNTRNIISIALVDRIYAYALFQTERAVSPPIFAQFLKFVVELEDMLGQQLSNLEGKYSWILLSLLFSFSFAQVV